MDFTFAFTFIVKYSYETKPHGLGAVCPDSKAQEGSLSDVLLAPSLGYAFPSASSWPPPFSLRGFTIKTQSGKVSK